MKSDNKILFTSIPKLVELKYFLALIDFREMQTENVFSNYNWQKIKARRLVENNENILAAPVERGFSRIDIIIPEKLCGEEELNRFIAKNNIRLSGPYLLQNKTYCDCILHTMTVRLSPEWNKINNYFVKGQNFLRTSEAVESIQLQLLLTDGCLAFSAWPLRLKLPRLGLIDLGVDIPTLYERGQAIVNQKVHILPRLKQATAVKVHLKLPNFSPFRNYADMKNHWKLLYGLNLPEGDTMAFLEVVFDKGNFRYSYPLVCVCPYEPIWFRCKNGLEILKQFVDNLESKLPKICGHSVQFNMKENNIFRPISKLYMASEVVDKPNLSLLVSDSKVIQDFQNENNPPKETPFKPDNKDRNRRVSPLSFFPSFGENPAMMKPKPAEETFKCFPIFKPKFKTATNQEIFRPAKKQKTSPNMSYTISINGSRGVNSRKRKSEDPITKDLNESFSPKELKEEVETLAKERNLKKLSLSSMVKFSKEKGILIKSKDKKETVMRKIYDYYGING